MDNRAETESLTSSTDEAPLKKRIMLLKVPIDIVSPEELPGLIDSLVPSGSSSGELSHNTGRNIVLLSTWDLLRARRNDEYRNFVLNAALVIPVSKSLVSGVKFLTGRKIIRYMPFKFAISLLTFLEGKEYPLYLLGGESKIIKKAEKNIRSTFPRLRIIGRFGGPIKKSGETAVTEAIRRSSPSMLLAGRGIRGGELWLARNSRRLNTGLRIWCSDLFDVFAEKRRRPSDRIFEMGLESVCYCFRNPFKLFRIVPYVYYKFLLLFYKIFKW